MALPNILLIDDNNIRAQQIGLVFRFMEYRFESVSLTELDTKLANNDAISAVFVGDSVDKIATVIKGLVEKLQLVPVVFLVDKGGVAQVSTIVSGLVALVLEWPFTVSQLKLMADKYFITNGQSLEIPRSMVDRRGYDRRLCAIDRLKGESTAIVNLRKAIFQVAESDATVLVLGESGTGKELVARALHDASFRRAKLFVPINCGAIPGELLESELFGHEKGAFTGALTARQGRFELAEGGTLFLDEIGDMPLNMQVKLLRVLQERCFERVGSSKSIECDVRVIAATHRALENEIKAGRFREDLFYRLNVFPIEMPSLRERPEDIPHLVKDLIERLESASRGSVRLTSAAIVVLMQYDWPGNVRELANLIERLAILYPTDLVDIAQLPDKFQQYSLSHDIVAMAEALANQAENPETEFALQINPGQLPANFSADEKLSCALGQLSAQGLDLKDYLNKMETDLIRQALTECNGVVAHAAKRLNMRRTTLVEKLRKIEV